MKSKEKGSCFLKQSTLFFVFLVYFSRGPALFAGSNAKKTVKRTLSSSEPQSPTDPVAHNPLQTFKAVRAQDKIKDLEITRVTKNRNTHQLTIQGTFSHPNASLLILQPQTEKDKEEKKIPIITQNNSSGKNSFFSFSLPETASSGLTFLAISQSGIVFKEKIHFVSLLENNKNNLNPPKFFRFGLEPTAVYFSQDGGVNLSQINLTGSVLYHYSKNRQSRWKLEGQLAGTLLTLSSNLPQNKVRFLNLHLSGLYQFPSHLVSWQYGLGAGVFYQTMLVTNQAFGYTNMMGPHIFPFINYLFSNRGFIRATYRYSAIINQSFSFSLTSMYEQTFNLSWNHLSASKHMRGIQLEIVHLQILSLAEAVSLAKTTLAIGGFLQF